MRQDSDKPSNIHFGNGHTENDDVGIEVLQRISKEGKAFWLRVEDIWIRKLDTKYPHGCNIQWNA